jgi:glyoxylase-like metal-dependent hydrolase (beta-lactamase superfamily II)
MATRSIEYPHLTHPPPGTIQKLVEGIFWARIPLPFRLNHVNVWILDEGSSWSIVDCGIDDQTRRELWNSVLSGFLAGRPVRRVIATHGHTDHVGAAGFLVELNDARFETTLTEWMAAKLRHAEHRNNAVSGLEAFLFKHGAPSEILEAYNQERLRVTRYLGRQPDAIVRLSHGQKFKLGGREWRVIVGGGHADEHASFYCDADNILIAGDQILPRITPLVAVSPSMSEADPLSEYLQSLSEMLALTEHALVLPGHGAPFFGLHARISQLITHHEERLKEAELQIAHPSTAFTTTMSLFPNALSEGQGRLALGETLAHLHRLVTLNRAFTEIDESGRIKFVQV